MASTSLSLPRALRIAPLALVALCPFAAAGCAEESDSLPDPTITAEPPKGHVTIAEYVARVQPKAKRVTFARVKPGALEGSSSPKLLPQVFSDANVVSDDVTGSGPASSVELVTTATYDTFGGVVDGSCPANSFCADVTLNSFWTRHLSNTYVEVTSITDATGAALANHNGNNNDSPPGTCTPTSGCPSASLGLWKYTQSGAAAGVVAANGTASKMWSFANPDDADTYIKLRVVATQAYSNYTLSTSLRTVSNACGLAGATTLPTTFTTGSVTMPFSSQFYSTYSSSARLSKRGLFTIGTSTVTNNGTNVQLPSTATAASRPAVFVFWDNIDFTTATGWSSKMCYATTGTAPARQFVITWNDMSVTGTTVKLTFSAAVREGSDEIDLYYNSMTGTPSNRARGTSATVGAQDSTGTIAATGSTYNAGNYGTGRSYTLLPVP